MILDECTDRSSHVHLEWTRPTAKDTMRDIENEFRADPQRFTSRRNVRKTVILGAIGGVLIAVAGAIVAGYSTFSEWVEPSGASGTRYNSVIVHALGTPLTPVLIAVIGLFVVYSAIKAMQWSRTETGAEITPVVREYFHASSQQVAQLAQNFATGAPSSFLPIPESDSKGGALLELWLCDDDQIGYVFLAHRVDKVAFPMIEMRGERYRILADAKKRGIRRPVPEDGRVGDSA